MNRVTVPRILDKKKKGEKLVMLTAYDFPSAKLADRADADIILVGDSLANVVLGYENTLPVTMDEMVHHAKAVVRGTDNALVVGDMPYMSYHLSPLQAVENAGRYIKEAGVHAVKVEGGMNRLDIIGAILDAEIPVMGHLGLTPQSVHKFGGYRVQGKGEGDESRLIEEASSLEKKGVFAVVLEGIPRETASSITRVLNIPSIGIGAGPDCDGQVLVYHDVLGMYDTKLPKFVRKYADLNRTIGDALSNFCRDVRDGTFPSDDESYHLNGKQRGDN